MRPATIAAVVRRREESRAPLAVPVWQGRRGHPLAIAPEVIPEIDGLDPGIGLRQLLDRHAGAVLRVAVDDPGVVQDVDTPEDYQVLCGGGDLAREPGEEERDGPRRPPR